MDMKEIDRLQKRITELIGANEHLSARLASAEEALREIAEKTMSVGSKQIAAAHFATHKDKSDE